MLRSCTHRPQRVSLFAVARILGTDHAAHKGTKMEAKKPRINTTLELTSVAVAATVVFCVSLASCHRKTAPLPRAAISWSDYGRIAAAEAAGGNAAGALLARIRHAANGGNTDAEYDLGFLYKDGPGLPKDYTKATKWYRKAALQGNSWGEYELGRMYAKGQGVLQDYAKAMEWYKKAAKTPAEVINGDQMYYIGCLYEDGQGVPLDFAKAMEWYRKAAARGNGYAMNGIGWLYENGEGVPQNDTKAFSWWDKAAETPAEVISGGPMDKIGVLYANGLGVSQNYTRAMAWYRKAAAVGNADAMYNIGMLYANGLGVPQHLTKAVEWFHRAAAQGNGDAYYNLGILRDRAHAIAKAVDWYSRFCKLSGDWSLRRSDYVEAAKWYRKGAPLRNDYYEYCLGEAYAKGQFSVPQYYAGLPQDYTKAMECFRKAAARGNHDLLSAVKNATRMKWLRGAATQGNGVLYAKEIEWYRESVGSADAGAMYDIGMLYANGQGVPRDYAKAMAWYRKAAAMGSYHAMFSIGSFYEEGHGVPKNFTKAMEWYRKAAAAVVPDISAPLATPPGGWKK